MDKRIFKLCDVEVTIRDFWALRNDQALDPDFIGVLAHTLVNDIGSTVQYIPPCLGIKIDSAQHLTKAELKRIMDVLLHPIVLIPLDSMNLAIVKDFKSLIDGSGPANLFIAKLNKGAPPRAWRLQKFFKFVASTMGGAQRPDKTNFPRFELSFDRLPSTVALKHLAIVQAISRAVRENRCAEDIVNIVGCIEESVTSRVKIHATQVILDSSEMDQYVLLAKVKAAEAEMRRQDMQCMPSDERSEGEQQVVVAREPAPAPGLVPPLAYLQNPDISPTSRSSDTEEGPTTELEINSVRPSISYKATLTHLQARYLQPIIVLEEAPEEEQISSQHLPHYPELMSFRDRKHESCSPCTLF